MWHRVCETRPHQIYLSLLLMFVRKEKITANKTHSFLLVTEKDVGDLLMLKFKWEETNRWSSSSMLKMVSSWWGSDPDGADVQVHKIRVRAGETQQKLVETIVV